MCTWYESHPLYEENMIKSVTKLNEYDAFINSFLEDSKFSDPHLTQRLEAGEKPEDMLTKKDHHCFVTENSDGINGLFILLIIPEEKYLEMLIGITREESAVEDLLSFIEKSYPGYEADFVFNPRNHLIKDGLIKRSADFDKEQLKMLYTHKMPECKIPCIEPLSEEYTEQYLKMHTKDVYWIGEKVMEATDRFKTFVAVEDGVVTGYIDVTHCFAENEPFDLLVKEEYRRKGYGRQLLAKALLENEPKDMMLLVDFDNGLAINLYESMGFIKKEKGNLLTAYWKVPDR